MVRPRREKEARTVGLSVKVSPAMSEALNERRKVLGLSVPDAVRAAIALWTDPHVEAVVPQRPVPQTETISAVVSPRHLHAPISVGDIYYEHGVAYRRYACANCGTPLEPRRA